MSTPHELRRRLAHGLRLGAAGVAVAVQGRPGAGGARPLEPAAVLAQTALLCRVTGRLLADEPSLARFEGLGAAQARLGDTLTRSLDPLRAALAVAVDPRCRAREAYPFALLGDLDTDHRAVARHLLDLGDLDTDHRTVARHLLDLGSDDRGNHLAHHCVDGLGDEPGPADRLELSWLRGLAEGSATPDESPDVPAGSVLERGADLLHGRLADARGLASAVLHATDWGLLPPRSLRPAGSVADDAEALLGAALGAGDLGLAAELVSTWPMLGLPLTRGARYALAELDRVEATYGFLPGPGHHPSVSAALSPADRSTYVVQTSCSTAVAGAVLAAALLHAGGDDGRATAGGNPTSGRRAFLTADADPLTLLAHADGPWAAAVRDRPLVERVGCTALVLGAELRAAAAHADLGQVQRVVEWADRRGWGHLPSVRQGAALVARVARATAAPATLAS